MSGQWSGLAISWSGTSSCFMSDANFRLFDTNVGLIGSLRQLGLKTLFQSPTLWFDDRWEEAGGGIFTNTIIYFLGTKYVVNFEIMKDTGHRYFVAYDIFMKF